MYRLQKTGRANRRAFAREIITDRDNLLDNILEEDKGQEIDSSDTTELVYEQTVTTIRRKITVARSKRITQLTKDIEIAQEELSRYNLIDSLNNIRRVCADIKNQFDDLIARQIHFVELKGVVNNMLSQVIGSKSYFVQALTLLADVLHFMKSENITREQIDTIEEISSICNKIDLEIEDVRHCGRLCRKNDMPTLPYD